MSKDTGGPAFPVIPPCGVDGLMTSGYPYPSDGMTLRDYFAAKALAAYINLDGTPCAEPDEMWDQQTAQRCYAMADAMLAERNKE